MSGSTPDDWSALIATAGRMADAAGAVVLPWFRTGSLVSDSKSADGFDPVTAADRAAETAMIDVLVRERPQDAVIGEEHGSRPGTTGLTWVLDPIDGTRGFIAGTPTWGILVAVQDETGPIFGIIDQPFTGERFLGGLGVARLEHRGQARPLATRATASLSEAVLFSTFPEVGSDLERRAFEAVSGRVRLTRYGMDCYAYALVALGQIDLVIEAGLQAYDIAAPIAVIEAAGGIVTDWTGAPVHHGGQVIAAANAAVHSAALEILSAEIAA